MQDLNLRLLPCEGSTLATELIAQPGGNYRKNMATRQQIEMSPAVEFLDLGGDAGLVQIVLGQQLFA